MGTPFQVQGPKHSWQGEGRTGTSYLPEETVERAEAGSPIEKAKLAKDVTNTFNDVYEYARAVREGELTWEDIEKGDMNTRLKWAGLVHRDRRTPGKFMMRMKAPNGIVNADLFRFYADSLEPYGPDLGVIDITTRQNIQLRGIVIEDAADIIDGLHARGQTSFQSALDNVRNMVGSPLAGIDVHEMIDTRPYAEALNDLITLNKETGERGNPVFANLPRKFNIAISGSRDDFAHTHINDIGYQPCVHATTGEMGFNIVLGGYMSTKRVAESVDMNLWLPARVDVAVELSQAILRIFRDEGERKDRTKARLMWQVESYGKVEVVDGHERCDPSYRERVVAEMASYGNGLEKLVDVQQPRPSEAADRTDAPVSAYMGVHKQPQEGLSFVGLHVPVGRLSVTEARQIADLAEKYVPNGEIRLTVEQNVILPNVKDEDLDALLAEPVLHGARLSTNPGSISGHLVSCTGAQFCGLAMIETKNNAEQIVKLVEARVATTRDVRIHWTGCPNSCGQVQAADIGLMGGPAKKMNAEGVMKAVPGVKIFLGGTIGEHGKLNLDAEPDGVPIEDLVPHLSEFIIQRFGGEIRPEFEEEQGAFRAEQAAIKAEAEKEAAAKLAKKKAGAAKKAAPAAEKAAPAAKKEAPAAKKEAPAAKAEAAPAPQAEAKAEAKPEAKLEVKAEVAPAPKPEAQEVPAEKPADAASSSLQAAAPDGFEWGNTY
jgi:ferredoxin-nitrite reductase